MRRYITIAAAILVVLAIVGCGKTGASAGGRFGKAIPGDMAVTSVSDIAANPQALEGKDVLVKGKITSECPSGGWVWVKDATGDIYVNMHPTNVFIPQKVGSTVKAMGKVVLEQGRPQVIGYGLEF